MNDTQILEQLARTDAYAPDTPMPAGAWDRSTALSEIQRRIDMKKPERRLSTGILQRWPGWLVAASAFAIVLIVGLGVVFLAGSSDTPPASVPVTEAPPTSVPATEAPSTTVPVTEAPPTTVATADQEAMNAALAGLVAALSGDGTLPSAGEDVMFDDDPLFAYVDFAAALETTVTLTDCVIDGTVATCRAIRSNRVLDAMGYTEKAVWTIGFNEAWAFGDTEATPVIVSLARLRDDDSRLFFEGIGSTTAFEEDFLLWMEAVHPEWRAERGIGEFENASFDGATGAIFSRYVDEYAAAIIENGPPELSYRLRW